MPLPGTFPQEETPMAVYGIGLTIIPGDPSATIEVQRAPDDGTGNPNVGAATTVAEITSYYASGATFVDTLPHDNARRFYRVRHTRPGWNPSGYTDWTRGIVPVPLNKSTVRPALGAVMATPGVSSIAPSATIEGQSRSVLTALTSLVPNGDFDAWTN